MIQSRTVYFSTLQYLRSLLQFSVLGIKRSYNLLISNNFNLPNNAITTQQLTVLAGLTFTGIKMVSLDCR